MSAAVQNAVRVQLLTGCRVGEIAGARFAEFDMQKNQWLIPGSRTKNKKEHLLPLSTTVVEIVESLRPKSKSESLPNSGSEASKPSDFLFPHPGAAGHLRVDVVTHELADALPRMELAKFASHDLRRTAATKLGELGTTRLVIDLILNHVDRSVGAIYDRYDYLPEKSAALATWARHLAGITDPKRKAANVVPLRKNPARVAIE
jgi:integrase